jgi:hypothetical protein
MDAQLSIYIKEMWGVIHFFLVESFKPVEMIRRMQA